MEEISKISNNYSYMSSSINQDDNATYLKSKLKEVEDKQGIFGNIWDGTKKLTGLGLSSTKCESMLEKYENGEIDFEQALEYIESFDKKQKNMSELGKNLITGTGAILATTGTFLSGGSLGIILATGAAVGAGAKTSLGIIDRTTNNVANDELNLKNVAKDAISGSITGAASAIPSSAFGAVGKFCEGNSILNTAVVQGTCSACCGATSGAVSYLTDVGLEGKDFNLGDMASATLSSALVSGAVGAGFGAYLGSNSGKEFTSSLENLSQGTDVAKKNISYSVNSGLRKSLGVGVKSINDYIMGN